MKSSLIKNQKIISLIEKYKVIWALNHVSALGFWDMETYMPKEGAEARGLAMSKIASLSQELFLKDDFVSIIKEAEKEKDLNEYELGIIRLLNRALKYYQKLPSDFIEDFVKTTSSATLAWREAKEKSDYSIFEPHLKKIVELSKRKAEYLGYKKSPYDALLDEFEEGLTAEDVQKFFDTIRGPLINLLNKIKGSKHYRLEHPLEEEHYDIESMKNFNQKLLNYIHYNADHIRIDTSSHPFSTGIGPNDHRITTRYSDKDFSGSYSSTIHEYGHSLYELQTHSDLYYTPIYGGSSLVIHESQSRFWENFLGRSKEFISIFYNDITKIGKNMSKYTIEDVYHYLNTVKPSLIRTESDELTYHFHIMIRFEIEKGLIEGSIDSKDVRKIWKEKYKEYLGIEPSNDREGVLQDTHWASGLIGYFPTYSMGTTLSAMWKHKLEEDIEKLSNLLKTKEGIKKIQDWLKNNIHQYGSTFTFKDLVKRTTGGDFTSSYLLDYLNNKYKEIYKLN